MRRLVSYGIILILSFLLLSCSSKRKAHEAQVRKTVSEAENNLQALHDALVRHQADHGNYPEGLNALTTPVAYIDPLAVDKFNLEEKPIGVQQNPYKYIKEGTGNRLTVLVYSFGPDGDNDAALVAYDATNGTISNGDIVKEVCSAPVTAQELEERRKFRFEIEQIRKASEDNGIREYMLAIKRAKYDLGDKQDSDAYEKTRIVIKEGWHGDLTDLEALIERNQASIDLIHQGGRKPVRQAVIDEQQIDFTTSVPNYLSMLILAKILVCQGKQFKAQGREEESIQNYINVIKFGQSVGNIRLVCKLINVALETMGYKALLHELITFEPDSDYLKQLILELEEIEKSSAPLADALWQEHLFFVSFIEYIVERINFRELFIPSGDLPSRWYLRLHKRRIIRNNSEFWSEAIDNVKKPFPEAIKFDDQARAAKLDKYCRIVPDISAANTRDTRSKTYAKATKIIAGLQLYKNQQGSWPDSLDQLGSILHPVPVDPFTDKDFRYEKVDDNFRLYSLGPDLKDDQAMIEYDPTNGTISPGDIVFRD